MSSTPNPAPAGDAGRDPSSQDPTQNDPTGSLSAQNDRNETEDEHPDENHQSDNKSALKPFQKKKVVTIMLIGETGSGKTTFMSLLVNLFMGKKATELDDKNNAEKESGLSKDQSQTTKATVYRVTTVDGTLIRILDTPGLADTRGIDTDGKHMKEINEAVKSLKSIDAVLIMTNGTGERLMPSTTYTLSTLAAMFPYSIVDNIGFIFTNSTRLTWNFKMSSLQTELQKSKYWLVQNPLATYKNYQQIKKESPDDEELLDEALMEVKKHYRATVKSLDEWVEWLDSRDTQPTKEINELYQTSVTIEAKIEATLSGLTRLREKQEALGKVEFELKSAKDSKGALKKLEEIQTKPVWEREESTSVNTLCIAPNCYSNCHSPCHLKFINDIDELARRCDMFRPRGGQRSTPCGRCKHPADIHRHYYHIHVQKPGTINPSTKRELDAAESEEQRLEIMRNSIKRELDQVNKDIESAQDDIRKLVDQFNGISLSRNFTGHINSAIQMLKYRKKELESKPNTETERKLIDETIAKFEEKLKIINGQKGMFRKAVDYVTGH